MGKSRPQWMPTAPAALVLLLAGWIGLSLLCREEVARRPEPPPRPARPAQDVACVYSSYGAAKQFVARQLTSPSTAKWPTVSQVSVGRVPGEADQWRIVSYVDSQNGFGAMVRTKWTAEVEYHGRDQWTLVSLTTD